MNKNQKQRAKNARETINVLESLRDIGNETMDSLKQDVARGTLNEVARQLFGLEVSQDRKTPDTHWETSKEDVNQEAEKKLVFEKQLLSEEEAYVERKANELRLELKALMNEMASAIQETQELAEELQIASVQAPIEPGIYHVNFFEKILGFIKSYRKRIKDASVWLHSVNRRAQKKTYWSMYKKSGAKFLLSSEHYLTRSAG